MGEDKLTRRFLWKKARQDRNGNYRDPDTAKKAALIVSLLYVFYVLTSLQAAL